MNLRILKKLSKRAAEILPMIGCDRESFSAERWENYHSIVGMDRKHWDRHCSVHSDLMYGDILVTPRSGKYWIKMREPSHPLKGTMMIGWMSGGESPEWDEQDAWARLVCWVHDYFTQYGHESGPISTRRLQNPADIFAAVPEVIAGHQCELSKRERYRWKAVAPSTAEVKP